MKVVILAGGLGTRISEESHLRPKPMIEIGGKPILWHIMKEYSHYGYYEFIICCGYKQHVIKEWFADYYLHNSDVTFDFTRGNEMTVHSNVAEPWRVTLVDTGLHTMTGGRIRRVRSYIGEEPFFLTYGDGVADVDIPASLAFHQAHGRIATITTVTLDQRFGVLEVNEEGQVDAFREKAEQDGGRINGGYMILNPEIFSYLEDDHTIFEQGPMGRLAAEGQLMGYRHNGFWQCMDTAREKEKLEKLWALGQAPWKIWEDRSHKG
ncbi:MAG: glucose-1-phosphate cytidylyltransferase [Lachnospiraceae bacterium]|nr:glucose-1-phosphate cytidylyltransferase [Lachnospiraceae bacterium]